MKTWTGDLFISNANPLEDVRLTGTSGPFPLAAGARLTFLSWVDTGRIPLHIRCSPLLDVSTGQQSTADWFAGLLFGRFDQGASLWWQSAAPCSDHGILARIDGVATNDGHQATPTEVLFFAARSTGRKCPLTPPQSSASNSAADDGCVSIKAVLLAAELLEFQLNTHRALPPSSTFTDETIPGVYLPELPVFDVEKKRKALADTFDEASKRRKLAKTGPLDIEPTATLSALDEAFTLPQALIRSSSAAIGASNRPLSRTTSLQLTKSRSQSPAPRPGTSHGEHKAIVSSTEQRNRDLTSRLVLAGMRLHSLVQSKSKTGTTRTAEEKQSDEEFKLVYHNTLKAVTFAFRGSIGTMDLRTHTALVQEKVELMLNLFCSDPLVGPVGLTNDTTPSGRTPFKTPTMQRNETCAFPYPSATGQQLDEFSPAQQTRSGVSTSFESHGDLTLPAVSSKDSVRNATRTRQTREPGF